MNLWKKLAALIVVTAPLGVFASASAVAAVDPGERAGTAEDATENASSANLTPLDDHDPDRSNYCVQRCYEEFFECRRSHGPFDRDDNDRPWPDCRWLLERCLNLCHHWH